MTVNVAGSGLNLNGEQNSAEKEDRKEDDFLFGSISAANYQEFVVTKINKRGKRQTRVSGIDGFNIYNIRKDKSKTDNQGQP